MIGYSLPKTTRVNITIYDQSGRALLVVKNEEGKAGSYLINVDCSNFQTGAYYYRLTTNETSLVRKMLVER